MKTKVNILDYFAYSNYCLSKLIERKSKKYWFLTQIASSNYGDSSIRLSVLLFLVTTKYGFLILNKLGTKFILNASFILFWPMVIVCYIYYKKTEDSMIIIMKTKPKYKIIIGHVCSLLFVAFSIYCLFTMLK